MAVTIPRLASDPQVQAASENRPPLARGSTGNAVAILQQALIDLGHEMPHSTHGGDSMPDGIFGPETEQVLKRFQQKKGLKDDGVAGRLTLQKLEDALIQLSNLQAAQMRAAILTSKPVG
jgi:peptidoglycan hydrolase-like protein with peptidoglycan-binding domain